MLEIKDLAGISEPLKKLIELVSQGVGGISRPKLTRKNEDAKAYEIKTIAQAILGIIYLTLKNKWVFEDFSNFVIKEA